jgi:TATA-binding protein-associated factor
LPSEYLERKKSERHFITQLLDPSKLEPYKIPIKINADLRKYQQDGVNWLNFLNKYQLHGILCDGISFVKITFETHDGLDMGLGKTLQTICIVASDHHERSVKFAATQRPDCKPIPSLVVCPTSVTGHWQHEILNYTSNLRPIIYSGPPGERRR